MQRRNPTKNPKQANEFTPATSIQIAEADRLQIRQKELTASRRRPYILIFSILAPTLTSKFLLGPEGLLPDPFSSFQAYKENELAALGNNFVSQITDETNQDLDNVTILGTSLPTVSSKIAEHPLLKYRSYGKYLDSLSSNDHLTRIEQHSDVFFLTQDQMKEFYCLRYISIVRHLHNEEDIPKKFFILENIEYILDIGDMKKRQFNANVNLLKQQSFSYLAELIIQTHKKLKAEINSAVGYKQARHKQILDTAKTQAFDLTHYRFMLALVSSWLIFTSLIEKVLTKNAHRNVSLENISEQDAKNLITQLKSENILLHKNSKHILILMGLALSYSGYQLNQKGKASPAFVYTLLLTSSISLFADIYLLRKEHKAKQHVEKNMNKIILQLNKAVNSTGEKWNSKLGSTLSSSFLVFSPEKEYGDLSKRCLNQVVKSILLKNGINVISCERNMLTVDPIKLSDETAEHINNEINIQLKRLQDIKTLTTQLKQLFRDHFYMETINDNGLPSARFSLPLPNDFKLDKFQKIFPNCTLEINGNLLILTGHTPAPLDFAKHLKTQNHPQYFPPTSRKKAKIYIKPCESSETKQEQHSNEIEREITVPDNLANQGKILQFNGGIFFARKPGAHSHVTQDQINALTGNNEQERITRSRGQSGYKLRTDGILCYKKQDSRKRLFFMKAEPVQILVDGILQEVPSFVPDRIVKKR